MKWKGEYYKLEEWEPEEISDVLVTLEKSFGIKFKNTPFLNVQTFGDVCDVFTEYISTYDQVNDCTKQQAFYKIREAISATQPINKKDICLDTRISDIFLDTHRRKNVKAFKHYLNSKFNILTPPDWIVLISFIGIILSLITFFFSWRIALSGLAFFIFVLWIADYFGKCLTVSTVRELVSKMTQEEYAKLRRNPNTVNPKEIDNIIIDTFCEELYLDKNALTRETPFSWAKVHQAQSLP
jgi:acyl carrier protein